MFFLVYVLLGLSILILFSGGYVFCLGCVRQKEIDWLSEEQIKKTPYAKCYDIVVTADQWLRGHNAQDVYVTSFDGLKLHGLWIPAENAKGTVLLSHGYRSTKLIDFGLAYIYYHELGLNILVPDQRSHGQSEGRFITFGVKESRDMQTWLQFHNETFGDFPVVLYGMSMGASTVLYLADADLPKNVCGIIADCGFTSPKEILKVVYRRTIHLPPEPSVWAADLFARVFAGFRLSEKDTRKTLPKSKLPVLMIHGKADTFVPYKMTKEGFDACAEPKYLHLVENAGHGVSFLVDQDGYSNQVLQFLKTYMEGF